MKTLTVAEAAMNLDTCLKTVHEEHESYELIKSGVPYARLVPVSAESCSTHELADDLASTKFALDERREMRAAIQRGRGHLKALKNPWG